MSIGLVMPSEGDGIELVMAFRGWYFPRHQTDTVLKHLNETWA